MSSAAAFEQKEQIRQAINIVDLVGSYLQLRRQGRNYVALCPWHDDSRPSLQVNAERQTWKCWVCDVGGDIFNFIMQREGVDFREALSILAERAGISLAQADYSQKIEPGSPQDKQTLYQAMAWAEEQYHQCLTKSPQAEPARKYLSERSISEESVKRFHLGFSPDSWQWILDRAATTPYSPAVLEAIGLVAKSPNSGRLYDRFKGRLMFSIRDLQQRPIAFGGRVLPEFSKEKSAKYINSPETRLFSKSEQLYGLDIARDTVAKSRQVVIVEGYTDVIIANQFGIDHAVAVLGTALGTKHIQLLRRFADSITLVLDGDEAGQRRTNEILELFISEQVDLKILTLPQGLDPCDFLLQQGADALRDLLAEAVDALEHRIHLLTRDLDPSKELHQSHQAVEGILATLAKAPRLNVNTSTSNRLREQQILSRLARDFQISEVDLRERLRELRRQSIGRTSTISSPENGSSPTLSKLDATQKELFELLSLHPEYIEQVSLEVLPSSLPAGPGRIIYETYYRLFTSDREVGFPQVLTELEDPQLKNLLVQIDEQAHAKALQALDDTPTRLRSVIRNLQAQQLDFKRREKLSALEQRRFDDEEELEVLLEMIQQDRNRQGISAPTDG